MQDLYYTPLDYAIIINKNKTELNHKEKILIAESIYLKENNQEYIAEEYRNNSKRFLIKYMDSIDCQFNIEDYRKEKCIIERDLAELNIAEKYDLNPKEMVSLNLFFKDMRICLAHLSTDGKTYKRMKLKTFLTQFGLKKRSEKFKVYIKECMDFYQIYATKRGNKECDIRTADLDIMVTFRVR